MNWTPRLGKDTDFAQQMEKARGCVLWSRVTVSSTLGWATQLSVYSGYVLWSDGLKTVISNEWGNESVSLRCSSQTTSTTSKALLFCLRSWLKPIFAPCSLVKQVHWFFSAHYQFCLPRFWLELAALCSLQAAPLATLGRWSYDSTPHLGRAAEPTPSFLSGGAKSYAQ